jgi:hypothetical protein
MATKFAGACLCGAVRYECSAELVFAGLRHWRDSVAWFMNQSWRTRTASRSMRGEVS